MSTEQHQVFIPDLCRNSSVLLTIILVELWAMVVSLLLHQTDFFLHLGSISLYLQLIALSCCLPLCLLKSYLRNLPPTLGFTVPLLLCMGVFGVVEVAAQALRFGDVIHFDWPQFFVHASVALIVFALLMRWFYLLGVLEQRGKAESESRVQALQYRIRPHFLFNSLNTIAELVAIDPASAEQAIKSLSVLFRANLENTDRFYTLERELHLCKRYVELERWRLGETLQVDWQVDVASPSRWHVPKLILQPLIENAIVHGGRDMDSGKLTLQVGIKETDKVISILVENPIGQQTATGASNGIAINNIKERLFVLYDDQQSFRVRADSETYKVILQIPKQITKI